MTRLATERSNQLIVAGNRQLLAEGRGIVVEPQGREIAAGIETYLNNPQKRQTYILRARTYVESEHDLTRQSGQLAALYRSLCAHLFTPTEMSLERPCVQRL